MHIGPNIEKEGLLFGYDTGEFPSNSEQYDTFKPHHSNNRFYKGKSSINYIAHQNAVRNLPTIPRNYTTSGTFLTRHPNDIKAYDVNGNQLQSYVNHGVGDWTNTDHAHWQHDPILNKPVVVMYDKTGSWKAKSFGTGLPSPASLGMGYGNKYTISWLQWVDKLNKNAKAGLYCKNISGGNGFHDGQANSLTAYNTKVNTWQRVYQTYTISTVRDLNNSYQSIYMYGHYNTRGTLKIADVQIDLEDHPTKYQEFNGGTTQRSTTEGLLDLSRNSTINTDSVSFDSAGFIHFDGSDDIINTEQFSGRNPTTNPFTIEAIAKSDTTSGSRMWLDATSNGSNQRLYCASAATGTGNPMGIHNSAWDSSGIPDTDYHHYIIVMDGSTAKLYNNGVLHSSKNYSSYQIQSINVGGRDGYRWVGKIPIFKLYDTKFSDLDIKQNFKAYKNRFNL